jgi:hypothetical protein
MVWRGLVASEALKLVLFSLAIFLSLARLWRATKPPLRLALSHNTNSDMNTRMRTVTRCTSFIWVILSRECVLPVFSLLDGICSHLVLNSA